MSLDKLDELAGITIARIRPNRGDRESREDCRQTALLAGLMAVRSAARRQSAVSSTIILKAMQSAVYRSLHKAKAIVYESDVAPGLLVV